MNLSKYRFEAYLSVDPDVNYDPNMPMMPMMWIPFAERCRNINEAEKWVRQYNFPYVEVHNTETGKMVMVRRGDEIIRSSFA